MKKILLITFLATVAQIVNAQNQFKTSFNNSEANTVELSISVESVEIVGGAGNEIIIESIGEKNPRFKDVVKEETPQDLPDRAKGLKPVGPVGNDNTGMGLTVEKSEGHVRISSGIQIPSGVQLSSNKFRITIPNKVKLLMQDMHHYENARYNYRISKLENEINVSSMNSNFVLSDITGPMVLNTINGNVEAAYSAIKTTKPISIVTVNGFVDLTIPASTKADLQFHTVNGQTYTDFEVKPDENNPSVTFPNVEVFHLSGKVNGGGGIQININSVNGDIYLRKK